MSTPSSLFVTDMILYDYYPPSKGRILIYVGRVPDPKSDPGIRNTPEALHSLYKNGYLTGEALKDAKKIWS